MRAIADSIGLLAAKVLERPRQATVLATFERSFCLDADGDLIAVVAENLPDGPLNLRIAAAGTGDLGARINQRWSIGPDCLKSVDGPVIDIANTKIWRPKPLGAVVHSDLVQGLDTLQHQLTRYPPPEDGLARLVPSNASGESPIERVAAPLVDKLQQALRFGFRGTPAADVDDVTDLIGLGPGLTPSGDDLLGGVLIACHQLHENTVAKRLGDAVLAHADRTNVISQAHLRAAALGYGAAPLHDLLDAIARNDRPDIALALDATAKIGHSSGFDALSGIILALQSYLAATSG
jgi:hypothetical protein